MRNTEEIWSFVDAKKQTFEKLADDVWAVPETCFGEYKSVALHKQTLESRASASPRTAPTSRPR